MGGGVTRIWGFRFHLTSMGECADSSPTKSIERVCVSPSWKEQICLLCAKVVFNNDFRWFRFRWPKMSVIVEDRIGTPRYYKRSSSCSSESPTRWHCNPRQINDRKCMEPAQKSDSRQLRLEQTEKHSSPTDMLRLFSFDSHAIQNSPRPQEHLSWLSQSTPCWNLNRKSRFDVLSTCEWQLCPQRSIGATLIGPSALTRFWVGKTGANQVLRHMKSDEGLFWKSKPFALWPVTSQPSMRRCLNN